MMQKIKRWLSNLLVMAVSTLLVLVVLEILIRAFGNQSAYTLSLYPIEMFDMRNSTQLKHNYSGQFPPSEISGKIEINSKGLRDKERPYESQGKLRILALGDSFVFGHGVDFEYSYVSLLNEFLNRSIQKDSIDVINAGTPGVGPQQYHNILSEEGLKYHPDLILLNFFVGNDVHDIQIKVQDSISLHSNNNANAQSSSRMIAFKDFLRKNIHLYSFVVDRIKSIPSIRLFLQERNLVSGIFGSYLIDILKVNYDHVYTQKWQEALHEIGKINGYNIPVVLVIIPSREQVDDERRAKAIEQFGLDESEIDIYQPNKILTDHCNRSNIRVVDLLPEFRKVSLEHQLYFDVDPHFNEDGNKLAARLVFEYLMEYLQQPTEHIIQNNIQSESK